ncbi:uncharacterized protein TNCT_606491 [Trichonephila clavata]|uniref:Uncharacterized protein n=1 Tax=Trichonephila clavata TaxID=2740835 RepID=A0A8X6GBJ9_TRICU|nr:uncharacterized protein TNCT_606491 [Trichonephila clavata]
MELKQLLQRGGMTLHKWCTNLSPTNAKEFPLDRNSEEIQVKTGHDLEQYASSKAYGAVVYMQTVSITEESNCQLLCSKSRVAPTKLVTIGIVTSLVGLELDSNCVHVFFCRSLLAESYQL